MKIKATFGITTTIEIPTPDFVGMDSENAAEWVAAFIGNHIHSTIQPSKLPYPYLTGWEVVE